MMCHEMRFVVSLARVSPFFFVDVLERKLCDGRLLRYVPS